MGVSIVPENVSSVVKSTTADAGGDGVDERIIAVAKGQTFLSLLQENDVSERDAKAIVAALSELVDLNSMHVGQKVRARLCRRHRGRRSAADPGQHV